MARYRRRALAVVQRAGVTRVLPGALSQSLFDVLTERGADIRSRLLAIARRALLAREPRDIGGALYLNVGHTGLNWKGHGRWIERSGVRPIYFIHDLIPLTHPEYCRPGEPDKHLRRVEALLSRGVGVIANSRATINELASFAGMEPKRKVPSGLVAPLGVEPVFRDVNRVVADQTAPSLLPDRPYFAIIGTIEGRKNHLLILTIWAEMARRLGAACPQLVIIGQRGWESEQAVDILDRCAAIRGHVIELPRCDDATLRTYVRGARALLFPSFVEGYGLPLVEALASGTPVLASNLSVFRELAGNIPDYLSPIDGIGWMRAIEDYAQEDSVARAAQMARLEAYEAPTWTQHFALVDRWLDSLP